MSGSYLWDADWVGIDNPEDARRLEHELAREICPAHALSGRKVTAIGRRARCDDVLFLLEDGTFAQVHLTWAVEHDPSWPATETFPSFAAWQAIPPEDR